jgi:phosphoglucosamine mutase
MESLQTCVEESGAYIGFAFDGDGDRMLAVCNTGSVVDGDVILAVCGLDLKERGKLVNNTIVATVMSNIGFKCFCNDNEITMLTADVGDRYVLEKMLAEGLNFGGEQSGHVIFLNHSTTGDGILTALKLLSVVKRKNQPLSALADTVTIFPQVLVNAKVSGAKKHDYHSHEAIKKATAEIEAALQNEGRILVRPSGTEDLVRVMIEGRNLDTIKEMAKKLADLIEEQLK